MKTSPHVLHSEMQSIYDDSTLSQKQEGDVQSLSYLYFLEPVSSDSSVMASCGCAFWVWYSQRTPDVNIFGETWMKSVILAQIRCSLFRLTIVSMNILKSLIPTHSLTNFHVIKHEK